MISKNKVVPPASLESPALKKKWNIEDSENLYRIKGWGEPYFSINAAGNITVSPKGERGGSLDLWELVEALKQRNIGLPLLIRFSDILSDRIERLNAAFARAIARYNYPNVYRGVYPIKCNQHRHIVESLVKYGKPYQFGLEAGSKSELMIALAELEPNSSESLLICNGYKDLEYIRTALLARKLGHNTIIVIEQLEEVAMCIEISKELEIKPVLGIRAKLCTKGMGRWGSSTGDRAKFGLTIPEILKATQQLSAAGLLDCLQLLHYHIGSQIAAINVIKDAIREASMIYVELANIGANMQYLDVGGGLAVDYDGSKTNFYASKNYNMQNYANDIVAEIKESCEQAQIKAPTLVSESGRAIGAHHSVLIFDVLNIGEVDTSLPDPASSEDHLIIRNLWETYENITSENYQEAYHDAMQFKEESISLFNFGYLGLTQRAKAERIYWACCGKILEIIRQQEYVPDDLEDLEKNMASIYYVNLSVFQSAPDAWAIDQLFPILPIHRLNQEPTNRGILADLTCDSDGKIEQFIDLRDVKSVLELHPLEQSGSLEKKNYYLGMFLVGAYQEIMGNLHNLFGDTNVVHIEIQPDGYQIQYLVRGDTVTEVLGYVQYKAEDLLEKIRQQTEKAMQQKNMSLKECQLLLNDYEKNLASYTYLA